MAITTTKFLVVEVPSSGTFPWVEVSKVPFATTEERAALMPDLKAEARRSAGRVLVRTIKFDDGGKPEDATAWTLTVEDKLAVVPSIKEVSIRGTLSEWARVRQVLMGQPWAEGLIAAIDGKLGTD